MGVKLTVMAISGLHIALIAGVLVAVLRSMRIPRNVCGILAIPLIWFYVAATGWQSSAVRSAVMMSAVAGTWVIHRPGDLVNSLALSALAILWFEPGQLLQAGFQLSFGVVMGLALLVPVLEPHFLRALRFNADPFLPDPLRPRWKQALDPPIRWLATSLATGVAAFLSSLPFIVHTFHLFTPISMLANLAVVPLSGLALAANAASLMVTPLWPDLAVVFNASAWVWMRAMVAVSRAFAQVPGGAWYVPSPSWPWWWVYGAALLGYSSGHLQTPGGLRRCRPLAAVLIAAAGLQIGHSIRTTTLTILPGGEALMVDGPGRSHDLVVNTGGTSSGPGIVTPFLHAHGWNRVPVLALGHADAKCLGGAPDFLRLFRPGRILRPAGERLRSPAFQTALRTAGDLSLPVQSVSRGDVIAGWTVLSPVASPPVRTADDASLVLARRIRGVRILMLSQLSRQGQRALLDREAGGERLRADIVISGLPRDRDALIPDLLEAIGPRLILLASARSPSSQEVRRELRERLASTGVPVHFTGDSGALSLTIGPRRIDVCAPDGAVLGSVATE